MKYRRLYSAHVDKTTGLRSDQIIKLKGYYPSRGYPDTLRTFALIGFDEQRVGIRQCHHEKRDSLQDAANIG